MFWSKPAVRIALLAAFIAAGWAFFTQHVWEDYYITYRASRNLATGQGLVFTTGERVHSFTSPLGVLLPALASRLTGNQSDVAALWIFRAMAIAALAGAAAVATSALRRCGSAGPVAAIILAALWLTDAKTIDFAINGMETPFLLLFLAWMGWTFVASPPRAWIHLGLAWAGLMWSRPDAFVYIGAFAAGVLLFRPGGESGRTRWNGFGEMLRAGVLTTVLYLPWLLWAWQYYGTPVPHTITAKGLSLPAPSVGLIGQWLLAWPGKMWADPAILAATFMPAYHAGTGWPAWAAAMAAVVALAAALLWAVPGVRWEARVASLTALAGHFYLYSFVGFHIPWYLPVVTFCSLLALSLALAQALAATRPAWMRFGARGVTLALVTGTTVLFGAAAWQLRCQQRIIEEGQRRVIGEWLKTAAASPRDTVFLEPLGYIGFYSNLRMLDYPGLAAPEVVAARRRASSQSYPFCWSELIMDLQPDWVVLRPYEREYIERRDAEVLQRFYEPARVFDARPAVAAVAFLPGRAYLLNDAVFEVYRRRPGLPAHTGLRRIRQADLTRRDSWGQPAYDSGIQLLAHAPSQVEFPVNGTARRLTGKFGLADGAYAQPHDATDGVVFSIAFVDASGGRRVLLERALDPVRTAEDRGPQSFRVELPAGSAGRLELGITAGPRGSNAFDWTYWSDLTLETPHA